MSRSVLYISNVFGPCRYWMSEQRRAEGFRRYLPEFGWGCRLLVKACNCSDIGQDQSEHALRVPPSVRATRAAAGTFCEAQSSRMQDEQAVVQLACPPMKLYAAWLRFARIAGYRFSSAEDEAEVCHLVFPAPALNAAAEDGARARRCLLPFVRALGLLIGRVHEQGRVDWVRRGTLFGAAMVRRLGIDAVVGSFPARHNLAVAGGVSALTGVPWIADFRDSATGGWCCSAKEVPRIARCLRTARAVIHTSAGYAKQDRGLLREDAYIIENGFMEEELQAARRASGVAVGEGFVIRFLGALYPWRNLDMFLDGLREFVLSARGAASTLRFEYYGQNSADAVAAAEKRGVTERVTAHEQVSGRRALELTVSATVLLLPTNTVGHTGVPGAKFYEYLGARRPILAVGGRDEYVADALAKTGTGQMRCSAHAAAETLAAWYADWHETGCLQPGFVDHEIQKYSRRRGAGKLARILDEFVG